MAAPDVFSYLTLRLEQNKNKPQRSTGFSTVLKQLHNSGLVPEDAVDGSDWRGLVKKRLWWGAVVAAALLLPGEGLAYEGPWCAVINFGGMGPSENCSMPSFEVCRELAMQYGSSSFCRQNGAWPGYRSSSPKTKSPARKRKHRPHHS
jgi:hypothetical protein